MEKEITVAKFGSEIVCGDNGIDQEIISGYVDGLVDRHIGNRMIIVTSGAIKTGEMRLRKNNIDHKSYDDVTLAQLGCTVVMHAWESEFERRGIMAGGLLTTHHEIEDRQEGSMLSQTLNKAISMGVISIINENDALSDEELMAYAEAADNDSLASLIALKSGADSFDIYTEKGGIYDDDGKLIPEINQGNYYEIEDMLILRQSKVDEGGYGSSGRGGAVKKIQAARKAAMAGIEVSIMAPSTDMVGDKITRVVW